MRCGNPSHDFFVGKVSGKGYVDGQEIQQKIKGGTLLPVLAGTHDRSKIVTTWVIESHPHSYPARPWAVWGYKSITGYIGRVECEGEESIFEVCNQKVIYGYKHGIDPREAFAID